MLTAITVVAVVGGALAWKTKNDLRSIYTKGSGDICNVEYTTSDFTNTVSGTSINFPAATYESGQPCVNLNVTHVEF